MQPAREQLPRRFLFVLCVLLLPAQTLATEAVQIALLWDGDWVQNEPLSELTKAEITTLTNGEFEVSFAPPSIGDWTWETALDQVERALADPQIDLVVTFGVLTSHAVCLLDKAPTKPVIAAVVIDRELQGCPFVDGASGVDNLAYVNLPNTLGDELEMFRTVVDFQQVVVLGYREFSKAIPNLGRGVIADVKAQELGIDLEFVAVDHSVEDAIASLPDDIDAVYAWPQFQLSAVELQELVRQVGDRGIPTFSALGGADLDAGMLASGLPDEFFLRLGRRVAIDAQRILLGDNAGTIPVDIDVITRLTVNMEAARTIGISPRWEALIEAELLSPANPNATPLALEIAVQDALDANLDLEIRRRTTAAAAESIRLARSALLPTLQGSATVSQIDSDRAEASFGSQAERTTSAQVTLEQLIYSEPANANLAVQRFLQDQREHELEAVRLDIVLDASVTYLDLLRAQTLTEILRENLRLTRSNLELARLRRSIGAGSSSEVLRWESQIASDRKSLVEALAGIRVTEVALNQLLHRNLETEIATREVGLDNPNLITNQERFRGYIETPERYRVFRDFVVQEALGRSPELLQLRSAVEAQERLTKSRRRTYYTPALGLQASYERILSRSGAGSTGGLVLPGIELATADDDNWSVGATLGYTFSDGGARAAELAQAELDLEAVELQLEATVERIGQQIRSQMLTTRASYVGIGLSQEAARAARQSLELVADAYSRGAVSILDLLDAQNATLNADLLAATAVYDFFIDLLQTQRLTGRFDFFDRPENREAWLDRLEAYFKAEGVPPLPAGGKATDE